MSILNYFREKKNPLPNPFGELSATIPSHAIATANHEVEIVQSRFSDKQKRKRKFKKNNIFDEKL